MAADHRQPGTVAVYKIIVKIVYNSAQRRQRCKAADRTTSTESETKMTNGRLSKRKPMSPDGFPRAKPRASGSNTRASVREPKASANLIAATLEEDIVMGRRHPRERLIEQDLCELFNTHRGDVRLALFDLEKKGIVQRIPNRGALVRDLTPKDVTEIYAVREELEVMAVRILPLPIAASDLDALTKLQRAHSAAVDAGDLLNVFHSNLRFHETLYGLCGNKCLIDTIELLAQRVYGIRSYANAFPETLNRARGDHVDMLKALRAARRDDLIALTRRHLKPSPEAYIRAYVRRFGHAAEQ
jgi:DNA-binding GntR family transcriptional regulator